jgi:hypothetical protein
MRPLAERDLILAPLASADDFLRAFFASHPAAQGAGSRIVLRAGGIQEPAAVTVERVRRPGDVTPRYSIHWDSENGGLYPEFDGELIVEADEAFTGFWITLIGAYEPPCGLAGRAFDAAVGQHIAQSTARHLLREMRAEIEARNRARKQRIAS